MPSAAIRVPAPAAPGRAFLLFAAVASAAVTAGIVLSLPPNHDVAWLLYVGRRLLAGDRMFVDIVEVNPPLIVWISTAAVRAARLLHVPPLVLYATATILLAAASAVASYRIALRASHPLAPVIGVSALFVTLALPGYDFGQREHLLVVLALPYLVSAASYLDGGRPTGIAAGLAAGIGFALKPYFLPAFVAVEGLLLWRQGVRAVRRPEALGVMTVLVAYTVAVLLFAQDYLREAGRLAPLYDAFARRPIPLLLTDERAWLVTLFLAVAIGVRMPGRGTETWSLRLVASIAATMLLAAVLMQRKGFSYHWYPAMALGVLAAFLGATPAGAGGVRMTCAALLLVMPLEATGRLVTAWRFADGPAVRLHELTAAIEDAARGRPVLALTARTRLAFPATEQLGLDWSSPYPFLWMLPGIFPRDAERAAGSPPAAVGSIEHEVVDGVWRLVERRPPGVVLLESRTSRAAADAFAQDDYFRRDPRFARMLARCRWKGEVASLAVCELP